MRVRSLMQTYRTLLASVEYARLPEGLDYDEVMYMFSWISVQLDADACGMHSVVSMPQ